MAHPSLLAFMRPLHAPEEEGESPIKGLHPPPLPPAPKDKGYWSGGGEGLCSLGRQLVPEVLSTVLSWCQLPSSANLVCIQSTHENLINWVALSSPQMVHDVLFVRESEAADKSKMSDNCAHYLSQERDGG